ncbi:hypothetical protein HAX54_046071, partial [Datura stramonium]|nr:hypothetical protein [Datura stramonium]
MESCLPHVKTHFSSPQFLIPNSKISITRNLQESHCYGNVGSCPLRQPLKNGKRRPTGKYCEEVGGMVELLECLEREVIMGEDE